MHKNAGFTYIEILIAAAVLMVVAASVFPVLSQARANQYFAASRRQAQGYAAVMALEARSEAAGEVVRRAAARNGAFIYRISLFEVGGAVIQYTEGEAVLPQAGLAFGSAYLELFEDGIFILAEVFDQDGRLAGMSVAMHNSGSF